MFCHRTHYQTLLNRKILLMKFACVLYLPTLWVRVQFFEGTKTVTMGSEFLTKSWKSGYFACNSDFGCICFTSRVKLFFPVKKKRVPQNVLYISTIRIKIWISELLQNWYALFSLFILFLIYTYRKCSWYSQSASESHWWRAAANLRQSKWCCAEAQKNCERWRNWWISGFYCGDNFFQYSNQFRQCIGSVIFRVSISAFQTSFREQPAWLEGFFFPYIDKKFKLFWFPSKKIFQIRYTNIPSCTKINVHDKVFGWKRSILIYDTAQI